MLFEVSQRLLHKTDVRRLVLKLNVPSYISEAKLAENDSTTAAYQILMIWSSDQRDDQSAYQALTQGLIDAKLKFIAGEVLNYSQW